MPLNRLRWIEVACAVAAVAVLASAFVLTMHFVRTLPRVPDPLAGRVFPLNEHGTFVYLTARENLMHNALFIASAVLFGVAVIVDVLTDPFGWRRR